MFRFLSGHYHPPMYHHPRHHPCAMNPQFQEAYQHVKKAYKIMKHMMNPHHRHPYRHRHPHRPPYCKWESGGMWSSSSAQGSCSTYGNPDEN